MYLLTAIFNRSCLNDVLQELYENKIEGVTVGSVIGKGGLGFIEEGGTVDLDEKVRLDIVVSNDTFKDVAKEAIRANAQDLGSGAGKMWVTPVLEVERIRTGETNESALTQSKVRTKALHETNFYSAVDTPST
jgi:nitrogen regulatory protein P-II 1